MYLFTCLYKCVFFRVFAFFRMHQQKKNFTNLKFTGSPTQEAIYFVKNKWHTLFFSVMFCAIFMLCHYMCMCVCMFILCSKKIYSIKQIHNLLTYKKRNTLTHIILHQYKYIHIHKYICLLVNIYIYICTYLYLYIFILQSSYYSAAFSLLHAIRVC